MRKQQVLFLLFSCLALSSLAQDNIPVKTLPTEIFKSVKKASDTVTVWKWRRGGLINLNMAQGTLSNWAAGGDHFDAGARCNSTKLCNFTRRSCSQAIRGVQSDDYAAANQSSYPGSPQRQSRRRLKFFCVRIRTSQSEITSLLSFPVCARLLPPIARLPASTCRPASLLLPIS